MRYYEREHVDAYARIEDACLDQWSDLHEHRAGFDDFPNRAFLERALPLFPPVERTRVLEYGSPVMCHGTSWTERRTGDDPDRCLSARPLRRRAVALQRGTRLCLVETDEFTWPRSSTGWKHDPSPQEQL